MFYVVSADYEKYATAEYSLQEMVEHTCEKCESIYRSDRVGPYRVHFRGGKLPDFYNAPGCYIGNKVFFDMLEKYQLTGYEQREIECTDWISKRGHSEKPNMDELKEIFILGKCGSMCHVDGTEVEKCPVCDQVSWETEREIRGLSVPEETWDGSDVFSFSNWQGVMIVTQRFKDACEAEKIKGITFKDVNKFCFLPWIEL